MDLFIIIFIGNAAVWLIVFVILKRKKIEIPDTDVKKSEYLKNIFEMAAISIAACWAIYVFYQEHYAIPPIVNISAHHEVVGKKGAYFMLRSTVTVNNPGNIRTRVLASYYNLKSYQTEMTDSGYTDSAYIAKVRSLVNNDTFNMFPRYYKEKNALAANSGKILGPDWWLDPQEVYTTDFISIIPDTFDIIEFYTRLLLSYDKETKDIDIKYECDDGGFLSFDLKKGGKPFNEADLLDYGISVNSTKNEFALREDKYVIPREERP